MRFFYNAANIRVNSCHKLIFLNLIFNLIEKIFEKLKICNVFKTFSLSANITRQRVEFICQQIPFSASLVSETLFLDKNPLIFKQNSLRR